MTQLENVHNAGKATTSGVKLLSRLLVVPFASTVSLAPTAGQTQGASRAHASGVQIVTLI
jgi:hypothetical protein